MPASILSPEHAASFERDGFVVIPVAEHGLADPTQFQAWTDEILGWPLAEGKWMPYDEINTHGERQIMRTEKIIDYHEPLKEILSGESAMSILKQVTGKVFYNNDNNQSTKR